MVFNKVRRISFSAPKLYALIVFNMFHSDDSLRSADLSSKEIGDNLFDILGGVSLCEYEAVVVAHQPGVSQTHCRFW
jgi:hypothetical protein